jgi:predicted DNA-binding transcriptional regulator YafY
MSDKFDSLWTILNKLDGKEKVTASSLASDLEVSQRSIYRYITTLLVAGFPIDYDRENNSYVFSEGYTLKKPAVSVEETLALALSKKLLHNFGPDRGEIVCEETGRPPAHFSDCQSHGA